MKRIAVMTTGGDAPGMNAAIRAVVRTAIHNKLEVYGIEDGYRGLVDNKLDKLTSRSVSGIINRGGTILHTLRSKEFHKKNIRKIAYKNLKDKEIDGLIVIGGDGSRRGAYTITKETGIPSVFIPASIDNDVYGTDYTIGFDSAVNVALEAIDRIRDTAASHERVFIVEVMGREHGFLTLEVGLAGGAEIILLPEFKKDLKISSIYKLLKEGIKRGKDSSIIVMAEGAGSSADLAKKLRKYTGLKVRYTVLGYIQRGGSPTAMSRKLALSFGYKAVLQLKKMKKKQCRMVGIKGNKIVALSIKSVLGKERKLDKYYYNMNKVFTI